MYSSKSFVSVILLALGISTNTASETSEVTTVLNNNVINPSIGNNGAAVSNEDEPQKCKKIHVVTKVVWVKNTKCPTNSSHDTTSGGKFGFINYILNTR